MEIKEDVYKFIKKAGKLKSVKRAGWLKYPKIKTSAVEDVADHCYKMALLSLLFHNDKNINFDKCVKMALLHDLAEAVVGDITPHANMSKEDKKNMEYVGLKKIIKNLNEETQKYMLELWNEYEDRQTIESKIVKDLDIYDVLSQSLQYEKKFDVDLSSFFEYYKDYQYSNDKVKLWHKKLMKKRKCYSKYSKKYSKYR